MTWTTPLLSQSLTLATTVLEGERTSFFLEYLDKKSWKLVPCEISLSSEA